MSPEEKKEYQKNYYLKNIKKMKEYHRKYQKEYYHKNKEKIKNRLSYRHQKQKEILKNIKEESTLTEQLLLNYMIYHNVKNNEEKTNDLLFILSNIRSLNNKIDLIKF
jgi:conjugal transfer/entry exclusion protein